MTSFRQSPRTACRVIDGTAFVVAIDTQTLIELNQVGTLVWEKLSSETTVDALTEAVCGEFEVGREVARRDVDDFVRTLVERGVVFTEPSR